MRRMRRVLTALSLCAVLAFAGVAAQPASAPHREAITARQLRADLFFLAGDGMQGRLTDTATNALAADWILSRFERAGLQPAGHGGTFEHRYALMTASLADGNAILVSPGRGATASGATAAPAGGRVQARLRLAEDFYPHRYTANAAVEAAVVFAGFGIVSPERGHDDYGDAARGRIVLILDREPGVNDPASLFDGVVTAEAAQPLKKVLAAQDKGAAGVLFVEDVHNQTGPAANFQAQATAYWPGEAPRVERYTLKAWADRVRIPVMQISRPVAERLVAGSGTPLLDLARGAEARGGTTPVDLGVEVTMTASVAHHTVADRSIVAMIEGADAALRDEAVIISAHYDHEGADGPRIYNGADDDGSGTVALLAMADAYAQAAAAGQRPRRSVIFAAWNSEERGLLGAWAYTEDPMVPLDRIAAVLNMDMIGRNEEVPLGGGPRFRGLEQQTGESNANASNIIGTERSPDLRAVLDRANQGIGLDLRYRYDNNASNLMRRSDHWPFIQRGVPAVWVHTGLHPDYHTIYDRPERINYSKMEKIARMVYQASWVLANAPARPRLQPIGATTSERMP